MAWVALASVVAVVAGFRAMRHDEADRQRLWRGSLIIVAIGAVSVAGAWAAYANLALALFDVGVFLLAMSLPLACVLTVVVYRDRERKLLIASSSPRR